MRTLPAFVTDAELVIASALAELAIARGGVLDEHQTPVYVRGLADLESGDVRAACDALAREPREDYGTVLPDVGTIRARAFEVARDRADEAARAKLLPPPRRRDDDEPTFHCLACFDEPNGWRQFWCPGSGALRVDVSQRHARHDGLAIAGCGRLKAHGPHAYTERCTCVDTNPVIAEHRRKQAEYQQRRAASVPRRSDRRAAGEDR